MKKKSIFGILLTIIISVVCYWIVSQFNPHHQKINYLKKESSKYNPIEKSDEFHSGISHHFTDHGFTYIELTNSKKIALQPSRNGIYKNNFIGDFIQVGDYLKKQPHSDTLFIERDQKQYYFILGKIINE